MLKNAELSVTTTPESKVIGFPFNYAKSSSTIRSDILLIKRVSSKIISLKLNRYDSISELKLTNSGIRVWNDDWVDSVLKTQTDPLIEYMDLSGSYALRSVNIVQPRQVLKRIDLSGSEYLEHLCVLDAPNLMQIDLTGCRSLKRVRLGFNKSVKYLSVKGCGLDEQSIEELLGGFICTQSGVELDNYIENKIEYDSYLDLRGNIIPWNNRRVASKIRLLLCNAVAVLWSNNPPENVIPIEIYRGLNI